ncbi:hypothetical protein CPB85DRAFT_1566276 [Mucidula mucida]|nr:hypothetical protein CPB85DRAFT_1566276 [Mucidula mucida]
MVLIINSVDVEDFSSPPIGPIPAHYGPLLIPNTEPRAPHSYMQRSVFGDEPFEFRVLAPTAVTGRPAPKPSSHAAAESWDHFLYRLALATTKDLGARPHQISDFPPDYPPRSVEPDYSHLLSKRDSVETVHPPLKSTAAEPSASDAPPSAVEETSVSAIRWRRPLGGVRASSKWLLNHQWANTNQANCSWQVR